MLTPGYEYDPLLLISTIPTRIKLIDIIGGIQHCIKVVVMWIFDRNTPFVLPLNCKDIENCCTDQYKPNETNFYRGILKAVRLFTT